MTLIELTVVILVMLSMITVLFIGTRVWRRGGDRAMCLLHIQSVQKGMRGFANLHGAEPGAHVPDLLDQIIGFGCFVEVTPVCPGGGNYTFGTRYGINTIPPVATPYMECSLATTAQHFPNSTGDW
jgi:hypothetical protein